MFYNLYLEFCFENLNTANGACIIEFIKRVGEKDKVRGFAEHLIGFRQRVK